MFLRAIYSQSKGMEDRANTSIFNTLSTISMGEPMHLQLGSWHIDKKKQKNGIVCIFPQYNHYI
jgi:hypothetical protein